MYFRANLKKNPRKTQGLFKNPRKNPRPSEKKPRTPDCFEKLKILGENPSSGNAGQYNRMVWCINTRSRTIPRCFGETTMPSNNGIGPLVNLVTWSYFDTLPIR